MLYEGRACRWKREVDDHYRCGGSVNWVSVCCTRFPALPCSQLKALGDSRPIPERPSGGPPAGVGGLRVQMGTEG